MKEQTAAINVSVLISGPCGNLLRLELISEETQQNERAATRQTVYRTHRLRSPFPPGGRLLHPALRPGQHQHLDRHQHHQIHKGLPPQQRSELTSTRAFRDRSRPATLPPLAFQQLLSVTKKRGFSHAGETLLLISAVKNTSTRLHPLHLYFVNASLS